MKDSFFSSGDPAGPVFKTTKVLSIKMTEVHISIRVKPRNPIHALL